MHIKKTILIYFAFLVLLPQIALSQNKTLVIILGETRAHEITFTGIKEHLLDVLEADLALCIGVSDAYDPSNPFHLLAKFHFLYPEPEDYAQGFDEAYNVLVEENPSAPHRLYWREFLKIKDQFMGGILDERDAHPGSAGILLFFRWFLWKHLVEYKLLDEYDFFVITRSDYIYALPHPKIDLFSKKYIYIPNGEGYGGFTDRHVVLPRQFVYSYLSILESMINKGTLYYEKMKHYSHWNLEQLIKFHLAQNGSLSSVRTFPYVMYTVRNIGGTTRWAAGTYSQDHNYFIKYPSEYERACTYRSLYQNSNKSLEEFYKTRIER